MIAYASRTGTKRNLAALKAAGWRLLVSRAGVWRSEGFPYALDNGAWTDHQQGQPFDAAAFQRLLDQMGAGADWCVAPDIVAGGAASLELSVSWMGRCRAACRRVLIAVQDGMTPADLRPLVGRDVGIFLGGSTEWKLRHMATWGDFCKQLDLWYHVARVNTARRMKEALASQAVSFDGSSASRFAVSLPPLDVVRRQRDLLIPERNEPLK